MLSLIKIKDIHQCEDSDHVYVIVRTDPRTTHVVCAGDLVPAGTRLVTPVLELFTKRAYHGWLNMMMSQGPQWLN